MNQGFTDIQVDDWDQGVRRVTIMRPEVRNAYRSRTAVELSQAVEEFARDDASRVLVITGSAGSFCAGGDLKSNYENDHGAAVQLGHGMVIREAMHRVMRQLQLCDKPVIAMIRGPAVAGGLALALACDLRIADTSARLGDTSGLVGLLPDEGGAWLFPRAMGTDRALRMIWGAEVYDAEYAREVGLITEVFGEGQLGARVLELARRIAASLAPLTTRVVKRMVRNGQHQTLGQALQEAEYAAQLINESSDADEGINAFSEKRSPCFRGR